MRGGKRKSRSDFAIMESVEGPRVLFESAERGNVEVILFADGGGLQADERGLRGVEQRMSAERVWKGVGGEVGIVQAGHASEDVELAVLTFLDDANGAFLVGKIGGAEFAGEAFAKAGEAREEAAKVVLGRIEEDVHVQQDLGA